MYQRKLKKSNSQDMDDLNYIDNQEGYRGLESPERRSRLQFYKSNEIPYRIKNDHPLPKQYNYQDPSIY